jgi:hypothetical protein
MCVTQNKGLTRSWVGHGFSRALSRRLQRGKTCFKTPEKVFYSLKFSPIRTTPIPLGLFRGGLAYLGSALDQDLRFLDSDKAYLFRRKKGEKKPN